VSGKTKLGTINETQGGAETEKGGVKKVFRIIQTLRKKVKAVSLKNSRSTGKSSQKERPLNESGEN